MPTASHSQRIVLLPGSRQKLVAGADRLAESIRPTLGPNARTVVVEAVRDLSPVEILDDGGTIARRMVSLGDRDENMGAMLLRESLWQMHETVGDGAATAAVIFQAIVRASQPPAGRRHPCRTSETPTRTGGADGRVRAARAGAAIERAGGDQRVARWLSAMIRRWPTCWERSSTSLEAMAM